MTAITMGENEYRSLDRLNFSTLKYIISSPLKYIHQKEKPWEGSPATRLGNAVHSWLQGDKDKIFFEPDLSGIKTKKGEEAKNPSATSEGKALLAEFKKTLPPGAIAVPLEEKGTLESIEKNWKLNDDVQELRRKITHIEQVHIFEFEGLKFKAKLDEEGADFITDLKSAGQDASPENIRHTIIKNHYDMQAALYLVGKSNEIKVPILEIPYYMVFLETFEPFDVYVYRLSHEIINSGLRKLYSAVNKYKNIIIPGGKIYNKLEIV